VAIHDLDGYAAGAGGGQDRLESVGGVGNENPLNASAASAERFEDRVAAVQQIHARPL
jgi:hypothetical protein